jgi:hypothetical protein
MFDRHLRTRTAWRRFRLATIAAKSGIARGIGKTVRGHQPREPPTHLSRPLPDTVETTRAPHADRTSANHRPDKVSIAPRDKRSALNKRRRLRHVRSNNIQHPPNHSD